jgi:MraZ protein
MVNFFGEFTVKMDDKNRLVLPSSFKSFLNDGDMRFVVRKEIFSDCLEMFTFEDWNTESEKIRAKLNMNNREHALLWREYNREVALVTPDEKMGRISIPKKLLEKIGVVKEVVFVGIGNKIEVWAGEKYQKSKLSDSDYLSLLEKILG